MVSSSSGGFWYVNELGLSFLETTHKKKKNIIWGRRDPNNNSFLSVFILPPFLLNNFDNVAQVFWYKVQIWSTSMQHMLTQEHAACGA